MKSQLVTKHNLEIQKIVEGLSEERGLYGFNLLTAIDDIVEKNIAGLSNNNHLEIVVEILDRLEPLGMHF